MQIIKEEETYLKISILGIINSIQEHQYFIQELEKIKNYELVEVNMYDIINIDSIMVNALLKFCESNLRVRINVFKYQLYKYLLLLNIPIHYVAPQITFDKRIKKYEAIGIGGSADSLKKIIDFFILLPKSLATIFIVQHIRENSKNLLPKLLENYTNKYKIYEARDLQVIEKNSIYIAPSSKHLVVENGYIRLLDSKPINFAKPSIDILFDSLSEHYKENFAAILFCGYGKDGYHSFEKIKNNNGTIFVEDPDECQANLLLKDAINTKKCDYILKVKDIVFEISNSISKLDDEDSDNELMEFLKLVYDKYGYDFTNYQKDSIKRRIKLVMTREGITSFLFFQKEVLSNFTLFEKLFLELSINVSTFFRNPKLFSYLRENIMPYLKSYSHIKIWNAGCSMGEESYSIAILLYELNMFQNSIIYSTDINPYIISQAKNGLFALKDFEKYKKHYIESSGYLNFEDYFLINNKYVEIKNFLKEKILFFEHSLVDSGVFNEFQIIFCRNVFIYFDNELKEKVLKLFSNSLDRQGFLVLGGSETIQSKYFELFHEEFKVYKLKN